jgi:hypothetical protein
MFAGGKVVHCLATPPSRFERRTYHRQSDDEFPFLGDQTVSRGAAPIAVTLNPDTFKEINVEWTEEAINEAASRYEAGMSLARVAEHMGVTYAAIDKALRKAGVKLRGSGPQGPRLEVPPKLREVYETLGTVASVAQHYSVKPEIVYRWLSRIDVRPKMSKLKPITIPPDWNEVAPVMTQADLMRHYNCGRERIYRLMAATGVQPMKHVNKPSTEKTVREMTPKVVRSGLQEREDLSHLTGYAEAAAQFLRRTHSNVFKANIRYSDITPETWGFRQGLPNGGRQQYSVSGVGILWLDELIELAKKQGWKEPKV